MTQKQTERLRSASIIVGFLLIFASVVAAFTKNQVDIGNLKIEVDKKADAAVIETELKYIRQAVDRIEKKVDNAN